MKKFLTWTIIFLIGLLLLPQPVKAYSDSTNIINPDKISVEITANQETNTAQIQLKTTRLLEVKGGVEYFIIPTYINKKDTSVFTWNEMPLFNHAKYLLIGTSNDYETIEQIQVTKKLYCQSQLVGFAVTFDSEVTKISFDNVTLVSDTMTVAELENIYDTYYYNHVDQMFMMIEAKNIKYLPMATIYHYEPKQSSSYDLTNLYLGEDPKVFSYGKFYQDEKVPVIETNSYEYTTFVDNPITIPDLIKAIELTVIDEIDGYINDRITYEASLYESQVLNKTNVRERILGEYDITFTASDYSGNVASCTIKLNVVDQTKPTIDYDTSVMSYTLSVDDEKLQFDTILNNLAVTDNYSSVSHEILSDTYTGNEKILGEYYLDLAYRDEAGNVTEVRVTINVIDNTSPVITLKRDTYQVSYQKPQDINTILNDLQITVTDNYDDNLSYNIKHNDYLNHERILGTYVVEIEASDNSGNVGYATLNIQVIDDIQPIFYVNTTKVTVNTNDLLDTAGIKNILTEKKLLKNDHYDLEIIYDDYSENSSKVGTYDLCIKISYEDGSTQYEKFTIQVTQNSEKVSFFGKVFGFIKKVLLFIWKIIKWPFEKLFGLFV